MSRIARPTTSKFGQLIRMRRMEMSLSKIELAEHLGFSVSFLDVLETGRRGCHLDDLPRIAVALGLNPRDVACVYLAERHPELCRALFEDLQFEVRPTAGMLVEDTHWLLDQLPRRERGIVEALIHMLYNLNLRAANNKHQSFIAPSD